MFPPQLYQIFSLNIRTPKYYIYIYIYIYILFFSSYEHEVKTPFVFEIGIFRPLVDFIMELIN